MSDKEQIVKEKINFDGLFDFSSLYGFIHTWLVDKGYGVNEGKYSEKVKGNSRDITIEWSANKKLSDYFKVEHGIKFEISGLMDVEVESDGQKKRMNKGSVSVEVKGLLIKDYDSKWETTPFNRFLRDVYNKYVIPSRVDDMRKKVGEDVQNLKEQVKSFLNLTAKR